MSWSEITRCHSGSRNLLAEVDSVLRDLDTTESSADLSLFADEVDEADGLKQADDTYVAPEKLMERENKVRLLPELQSDDLLI